MATPRFLVLRGGAIGDFVVTVPALNALRARWPAGRIVLAGYPHILRLAQATGVADEGVSLERSDYARLFAAGAQPEASFRAYIESFDVVISYLFDPDGVACANLERAGARQVIYGDPVVRRQHAIDHLMAPLVELAIFGRPDDTPAWPRVPPATALPATETGAVILHPGSGSADKNWPLWRFLALARALAEDRWSPCFLLGEADAPLAPSVAASGFPVCSGLALEALPGLLRRACGYVGNDSGVSHIAAACGLPSVVLFGPSDPALWAPRGPHVRIIAASERTRAALEAVPEATVHAAAQEGFRSPFAEGGA